MVYIDDEKDLGWQALQERMGKALEPFSTDLGPRECAHGDWTECPENGTGRSTCQFNDTRPKEGMPVLKGWVLVVTVEEVTREDPIITSITAVKQRNHETKGLLHVALYE